MLRRDETWIWDEAVGKPAEVFKDRLTDHWWRDQSRRSSGTNEPTRRRTPPHAPWSFRGAERRLGALTRAD